MAKKKEMTFDQLPQAVAKLLEEMAEIKKLLKAQPAPAKVSSVKAGKVSRKSAAMPGEINIDKVCVILKRSKQTVYALVKSGKLKVRKQGRNLFFVKAEIEAYAASSNSKKSAPAQKKAKPAAKAKANTGSKPAPAVKTKTKVATKVSPKAKVKATPKTEANLKSDLQANSDLEIKAASPKKSLFPRLSKGGNKGTKKPQEPEIAAPASSPEPQSSSEKKE